MCQVLLLYSSHLNYLVHYFILEVSREPDNKIVVNLFQAKIFFNHSHQGIGWLDILGDDSRMSFDRAWEETGSHRDDPDFPETLDLNLIRVQRDCCMRIGRVHIRR